MGLRPGHSAVGSASALGAEGREFESRCPDHFFDSPPTGPPVGFFFPEAEIKNKCTQLQLFYII